MSRRYVVTVHANTPGRYTVRCTCTRGALYESTDERRTAFLLAETHAWPDHATVEAVVRGAAA